MFSICAWAELRSGGRLLRSKRIGRYVIVGRDGDVIGRVLERSPGIPSLAQRVLIPPQIQLLFIPHIAPCIVRASLGAEGRCDMKPEVVAEYHRLQGSGASERLAFHH